jgi:IclR family transcriptional regulator, KDG regulon repressor
MPSQYIIQPLKKALDVLKCIGQTPEPLSLKDIGLRLNIPKTTALRYLRTFEMAQMVVHDSQRNLYRIDTRIFSLINLSSCLQQLRETCSPHLDALQKQCNETTNLGVLEGSDIVYLEIVGAKQLGRSWARVGGRHPVHTTALGKAILAFMPIEARNAALPHVLRRRTARSTTERASLLAELDKINAQGFSEDNSENENEANCIGAPVFDSSGAVVAAFSISARSTRVSESWRGKYIPHLISATRAASRDLGYYKPKNQNGRQRAIFLGS